MIDERSMISWEEFRTIIANELGVRSLPSEKQDEIINAVGEAMYDRITIAIWKRVPPDELVKIIQRSNQETDESLEDPKKSFELFQQFAKYVPDLTQLIETEIRAGIRAYRTFLKAEAAKQTI